MKISTTHQYFSNRVSQEALTNPEPFLGPNYKTVLNFWYYLDTLSVVQWDVVRERYLAMSYDARYAAQDLALNVAKDVVGEINWNAVYYATPNYTKCATYELIAMHNLLEQGKKLTIVPLFDSL